MIQYENTTFDNKSIYYEILDDGFKIYIGQTGRATIHQYEPYIPDPSKSYEENAKEMCENLTKEPEKLKESMDNRLTVVESNVDYLMLLNDSTDE